ncbi:uncharacterized protein FOMMEDRAFT_152972 [Fomitiporia mediterranea MF3/22]|uniref:uncharacterized protein n=1 Tax=Fomitiporia mediterranea (strain MF3/22) TaxID=694068 RepID=UPI0004407466|nr:uncharacterized protein FOMMEDRAFT_152972 [Fomitiporia mediterranea MF3/22]EJD05641.1 hypothetical protein FOMMEDRAFT_152972 [Fomitiporia mediterranea MF3/22]
MTDAHHPALSQSHIASPLGSTDSVSSNTNSRTSIASSLSASITDEDRSSSCNWSSPDACILSPPTSPPLISSLSSVVSAETKQESSCYHANDRDLVGVSDQSQNLFLAPRRVDIDHGGHSGPCQGAEMRSNGREQPPFNLIPTEPETADAILVIPGPSLSSEIEMMPLSSGFCTAPQRLSRPDIASQFPSSPPSTRFSPSRSFGSRFPNSASDIGAEGNVESGRSRDTHRTCQRPSVQQSDRYQQRQRRGLLFMGAAMGHIHAARRAQRIPRGTRMRAYRVVWNVDPRIMFSEAGSIPVPMGRVT